MYLLLSPALFTVGETEALAFSLGLGMARSMSGIAVPDPVPGLVVPEQ